MKTLIIALSLFSVVAASSQLEIKSEETKVEFNIAGTPGTLGGFKGAINFDITDLAASSISGSVDVSTIKTGDDGRDAHLRNPDFFDEEKFPKITFKSTGITKTDGGFEMKGQLKMKDKVQEESIAFTYKDMTFKGTLTVFADDYGVTKSDKREESKVDITFTVPVI